MFTVNITHTNKNPKNIYNTLADKLGRNPTNQECKDEITRILKLMGRE